MAVLSRKCYEISLCCYEMSLHDPKTKLRRIRFGMFKGSNEHKPTNSQAYSKEVT
jgi:hypothetical protein